MNRRLRRSSNSLRDGVVVDYFDEVCVALHAAATYVDLVAVLAKAEFRPSTTRPRSYARLDVRIGRSQREYPQSPPKLKEKTQIAPASLVFAA
jgi:hypothetical protein